MNENAFCTSRPARLVLLLAMGILFLIAFGGGGCAAGGPGHIGKPGEEPELLRMQIVRDGLQGDQTTSLSRHHGRPVVLTFFATWCIPCIEDVAVLKELHRKYADDGLEVVAVAMDLDGESTLLPFLDQFDITYDTYLGSKELLEGRSPLGNLPGLPVTFFIGASGKAAAIHPGPLPPVDTDKAVQSLMKSGF